jgi:hypothetical protein
MDLSKQAPCCLEREDASGWTKRAVTTGCCGLWLWLSNRAYWRRLPVEETRGRQGTKRPRQEQRRCDSTDQSPPHSTAHGNVNTIGDTHEDAATKTCSPPPCCHALPFGA